MRDPRSTSTALLRALALLGALLCGGYVGWYSAPSASEVPASTATQVTQGGPAPVERPRSRQRDLRLPPPELVPPPPPKPVIVDFEPTRAGVARLLREFEAAKVAECDASMVEQYSRRQGDDYEVGRVGLRFYVWVDVGTEDRGVRGVTPTPEAEAKLRDAGLPWGSAANLAVCVQQVLKPTRAVGPVEEGTPRLSPSPWYEDWSPGPLYRFEVEMSLVVP